MSDKAKRIQEYVGDDMQVNYEDGELTLYIPGLLQIGISYDAGIEDYYIKGDGIPYRDLVKIIEILESEDK